MYIFIYCMHFFLHARTRSVFAEITNKNKCNLFTRNCDARLHFFARINFVYLSICCCALFASLTWFFFLCFACTHPHAYQDVCVCACCLFLLSCPIWDSLFFFWSPDGGFPSACSSSDSSSLCPSLLLDVLWFGLSVGFTPVQMTSLTQKQYIDSFFFFFCQGYLTIHTFAQEDVYFFPQSAAMFWLIDGLKTKNRIIYLYIYFRRSRTRVRLNVTVHQPQRPGRLQAEK